VKNGARLPKTSKHNVTVAKNFFSEPFERIGSSLRSYLVTNRFGFALSAQPTQKRHHRAPVCKRRLNQV
jgi:hypothetical protein